MRNEVQYLFIDGRYLHETLKHFSERYFNGQTVRLDPRLIVSGFQKCFYYDCDPARRSNESEEDFEARKSESEAFEKALRDISGVHVYKGAIRGMGKKSRQKGVDVALAVDMLTHSYRKNVSHATLLAGDLDFLPLVEALVLDGLYVTLWYCPRRTSPELISAVDDRWLLSVHNIYSILDPAFQSSIPPPPTTVQRPRVDGRIPIRRGVWNKSGAVIELYNLCDKFELVSWDNRSEDEIVRSHSSENILLDFAEEEFPGGIQWHDNANQ